MSFRCSGSSQFTCVSTSVTVNRVRAFTQVIATLFLSCFNTGFAHVKWFATYDLMCPPRPLFSILASAYFMPFCGVMIVIIFAVAYIDTEITNRARGLNRRVARITAWSKPKLFLVVRLGVFAFFSANAVYGDVLLTPELKTDLAWVRWLHLIIAAMALHPRSAFLSALGIGALYCAAISSYGWFHLLDYPIFLGVAYYLFVMSRDGPKKAPHALLVLRVLTGVTLLWGGMEKFAYPEWSFPLLLQRPNLAFGFNPEFFMIAAGFVEFSAAFLLIVGGLAARAASALLLLVFTAAIPEFGMIDLVGHAVIIIVLVVLIFVHNPIGQHFEKGHRAQVVAARCVALYFLALALEAGFFYITHWLAYG